MFETDLLGWMYPLTLFLPPVSLPPTTRPVPSISNIVPVPATVFVVVFHLRFVDSSAPAAASAEPTNGVSESAAARQKSCHATP